MIQRPDHQVLEALANLEQDHYFKIIRRWLEQSYQEIALSALGELDTTKLRMAQGAATTLHDVLSQADGARSALEKLRQDSGHR